eukprot:365720-Chlamydomonas_euryale.AAC.19
MSTAGTGKFSTDRTISDRALCPTRGSRECCVVSPAAGQQRVLRVAPDPRQQRVVGRLPRGVQLRVRRAARAMSAPMVGARRGASCAGTAGIRSSLHLPCAAYAVSVRSWHPVCRDERVFSHIGTTHDLVVRTKEMLTPQRNKATWWWHAQPCIT